MINEITQWISSPGSQNWISAIIILAILAIIITSLYIFWQLKSGHTEQSDKNKQSLIDEPESPTLNKTVENSKHSASLLEEAEVFIDYGLTAQAISALKRHLLAEPKDKKAKKLLDKLSQPDQ